MLKYVCSYHINVASKPAQFSNHFKQFKMFAIKNRGIRILVRFLVPNQYISLKRQTFVSFYRTNHYYAFQRFLFNFKLYLFYFQFSIAERHSDKHIKKCFFSISIFHSSFNSWNVPLFLAFHYSRLNKIVFRHNRITRKIVISSSISPCLKATERFYFHSPHQSIRKETHISGIGLATLQRKQKHSKAGKRKQTPQT